MPLLPSFSLRARLRRWFESRLPTTDTWALGQRNIYILPTRAGLTFAATLVVMLLASINYQLNLGYALTFLLAGSGLVSMHLTHSNLRGLTLHMKPPPRGFAGEPVPLAIVLGNPGAARHGLALRFAPQELGSRRGDRAGAPGGAPALPANAPVWVDVPAGGQTQTQLSLVPPQRGWHGLPTVTVETVFPLGLFRAWTVWRPAAQLLAWPQPEQPAPPLPASTSSKDEARHQKRSDGSEFDGVRPWRRGDTMRQVVWKKVARSNQLVSRETAGAVGQELWLEWAQSGVGGSEQRLSRLAAWLVSAEHAGLPCGLRLPGREMAPAATRGQRDAALDVLALWH
jgi:uncharacterized protein (DUF58 family)